MKRKRVCMGLLILAGILMIWFSTGIRTKAADGVPEEAEAVMDELEFEDIEDMMSEIFPGERIGFRDILEIFMTGDFSRGIQVLGKGITEKIFSILAENKEAMLHILVIALIAAVFANFSHVFAAGQAADMGFFVLYLLLITLLLQTFEIMIDSVTSSLQLLTEFMKVLCPVYLMASAVVTGSGTSVVFYNLLLFLIYLVQNIVCCFVIPLIHVYLMIRLMNEISPEPYLDRFADLAGTVIAWILKTMLVGIVGINLIQGLISPVLDQVKRSGLQKGLEAIPGIGNTIGGVTEIVLSAVTLIRNGIGVAGAVICVAICLVPLMQIAVMTLLYKLASALLEPVSDGRITACIAGAGDAAVLLLKTVYTSAVLFLITIVIVAAIRS